MNAYQLLAMLYKRKKHLINSHILNLTFSLVISDMESIGLTTTTSGNAPTSSSVSASQKSEKQHQPIAELHQPIISNTKAFEYLLCDLEIWYDTPPEIQRSLHERFNELLNDQITNARLFHRFNMLKRLLYMIKEPNTNSLNENTLTHILSTIKILIVETPQSDDLIKFGQYLASLLPLTTDKEIINNTSKFTSNYTIKLRNRLLSIVDEIISQNTCTKSINFQEELQRLLGYDWFLLFMQPNVHKTTLVKACKILFTLLLNIQNLYRFKESSLCGGWLNSIQLHSFHHYHGSGSTAPSTPSLPPTPPVDTPSSNNFSLAFNSINSLMNASQLSSTSSPSPNIDATSTMTSSTTNVSSTSQTPTANPINMTATQVPGFQLMQIYFAKNAQIVELYYLLFALLFDAQRIKDLPAEPVLDLNSICKYVFDKSFDSEQSLFCRMNTDISLDITLILFSMIRSLMNPLATETTKSEELNEEAVVEVESETIKDYAIILLQIFRFMYHNSDDFRSICSNADFLASLIATLYPLHDLSIKELASPSPSEIRPFAEAICNNTSAQQQQKQQDVQIDETKSYKSFLSMHPARKLVMDFLRDLLYDGIINSQSSKHFTTTSNNSIMDLILLSLPDQSNSQNLKRNQEFVTEIFKTIIDYMQASDLFNENQTSTSSFSNSNISSIMQNYFNLIDRLVDKLWDGTYRREPREVFELIVKLLNNLKKKSYSYSNEQLVSTLNRTILYQLSRSCNTLNEQVGMLDVLHKISTLKSVVFSQTNSQPEFFACLTYCLLSITNSEISDVAELDLSVNKGN
jgi:WD repeat and FYVE domain-containing protein 3